MNEQQARELAALVAWQAPDLELCGEVWPAHPVTGESGFIVWDPRTELHWVIRSVDDWLDVKAAREASV